MKKQITTLFTIIFISGCSVVPSSPKPHPEKYTFQIITIKVQEGTFQEPETDIEKIIKHPDVEISEYPIVLASCGESITNDQTNVVSLPVEEIADGKTKTHRLASSVAISFYTIRNNKISYNLDIYHQEFAKTDETKKPVLIGIDDDVGVFQEPNSWAMLGGFPGQKVDGKSTYYMICARTIPPMKKQ